MSAHTIVAPPSPAFDRAIDEVAGLMRRASSVLFVTGAGISAESGLPTYRGVGGLYEKDLTGEGIPIEAALSGPMFERRPEITWRYMSLLEEACRRASPSQAHRMLALIEQQIARTWVLTQNVDGLHRAAGSRKVIEIHGNIHRARCTTCGEVALAWPDGDAPRWSHPCPNCSLPLRPDVVLFGEPLPKDALAHYERELERGFDLVFAIGTTAAFPYIAGPIVRAAREGVPTIEINPGETDVSHFVAYRFVAPAGVVLEALVARMKAR